MTTPDTSSGAQEELVSSEKAEQMMASILRKATNHALQIFQQGLADYHGRLSRSPFAAPGIYQYQQALRVLNEKDFFAFCRALADDVHNSEFFFPKLHLNLLRLNLPEILNFFFASTDLTPEERGYIEWLQEDEKPETQTESMPTRALVVHTRTGVAANMPQQP